MIDSIMHKLEITDGNRVDLDSLAALLEDIQNHFLTIQTVLESINHELNSIAVPFALDPAHSKEEAFPKFRVPESLLYSLSGYVDVSISEMQNLVDSTYNHVFGHKPN